MKIHNFVSTRPNEPILTRIKRNLISSARLDSDVTMLKRTREEMREALEAGTVKNPLIKMFLKMRANETDPQLRKRAKMSANFADNLEKKLDKKA